ncbi:MAG TPA: DUF2513 domain-containing protein [Pseudomonas sp.]|nr:DUF2513 domain-containing protein [Pseudomonas sp.]
MKRDWNLIKELLLRIECLEPGQHFVKQALAQHCPHSVENHLRLMHLAGLIEGALEQDAQGEPEFAAYSLTAQGRDFLGTIRESDSRKYARHSHCACFAQDDLRQTA